MRLRWTLPFAAVVASCVPRGDLDDAAAGQPPSVEGGRGSTGGSSATTTGGVEASGGSAAGSAMNGGRVASAGATQTGGSSSGGAPATSGGSSASSGTGGVSNAAGSGGEPVAGSDTGPAVGGVASVSGGASSSDGTGGLGGTGGSGASSGGGSAGHGGGDAPSLPLDLPNTPVTGSFTVSTEASWEVDGVFVPTFEIHTPTASYWLVKSLGVIVSILDRDQADARQWIDFSSAFRPLRGLPSFGSFDSNAGGMSCVEDDDSQTPTHLRIDCATKSKSWRLVWDFYPTHVTLTVNAAPSPFGIAYRGVPGGLLDATDRFVLGSGAEQSAMTSSVADWEGAAEWAYVTDTSLGRSLFAIHHGDDELTDRYQVKDNDSALISFGDGMLAALPQRFSFGLVASASHAAVQARANFVIGAIH